MRLQLNIAASEIEAGKEKKMHLGSTALWYAKFKRQVGNTITCAVD